MISIPIYKFEWTTASLHNIGIKLKAKSVIRELLVFVPQYSSGQINDVNFIEAMVFPWFLTQCKVGAYLQVAIMLLF